MIPTYSFGYPTGKESGDYLAVDLGGTNLRVCHVSLEGEGKFQITQSKYRLTEEQKQASEGQELFDFCAECLGRFVKDQFGDDVKKVIPMGFTFSYPCS
jgi:hexokinase